jgi:hypothetical protein
LASQQKNRLARASLWFAAIATLASPLIGWLWQDPLLAFAVGPFLGFVAAVLGAVALVLPRSRRSERGKALVGLILGLAILGAGIAFWIYLINGLRDLTF